MPLRPMTDSYELVNLNFAFEYLDTVYNELSISSNGYICLGNNQECGDIRSPSPFDVLVVLNYDLDSSRYGSGQIYIKDLGSDSYNFMLAKIYVNLFSPIFKPEKVFMITYDEVMSYDLSSFLKVSFQVFLYTDTVKSFVAYKYKLCATELTLKAPSGLSHKYNPEKIVIENGQQCTSSNVGQPGLWVFEVTESASSN